MNSLLQFAATYSTSTSSTGDAGVIAAVMAFFGVMMLPFAIVGILMLVAMWKLFTKAGKPGWAAIVPIYNTWVVAEIGGKPGWWCFLTMIPIAGPFIGIYLMYLFVKAYGKDTGFFIGCLLLSVIFIPMLAFGKSQYVGNGAVPPAPGAAPATPDAPATPAADPWTTGTDTATPEATPAAEAAPAPEANGFSTTPVAETPAPEAPATDLGQPIDPTQQPMA